MGDYCEYFMQTERVSFLFVYSYTWGEGYIMVPFFLLRPDLLGL